MKTLYVIVKGNYEKTFWQYKIFGDNRWYVYKNVRSDGSYISK